LFLDLGLAEGRNFATGSRPKSPSFSSVILRVLPIKESYYFKRTITCTLNIQVTEDAEGMFFYLAGRRQPGKNTRLRQNNWRLLAARPVVFTESVFTPLNAKPIYLGSPDSVKQNQLSVLSALRLYPDNLVIVSDMAALIRILILILIQVLIYKAVAHGLVI